MTMWHIEDILEMPSENQKDYLKELTKKYNQKKSTHKKIWSTLFAAAGLGIFAGALIIALGGAAATTAGVATILSSTAAEVGISLGSLWDISNIELEAKEQLSAIENKMNKSRK